MYIVIIGCGRLGSRLAMELSNEGHDISIVDNNPDNFERLGSGFNGQTIKGVEIDNDTLIDAGINNADVFLAMTPDDNINIMASQIAKSIFGVKRVMARIFDPSREIIYNKLGLETVSATQLGVNVVKSRIVNTRVNVMATLDENITIIEVPIVKGKLSKLKEIEEKYNCIVSAILSDGEMKIPQKEDVIRIGDTIICTIDKDDEEKLIRAFVGEME